MNNKKNTDKQTGNAGMNTQPFEGKPDEIGLLDGKT
jgi:hypothetical protein